MNEPIALGVDVGSTAWKAVVVDAEGTILASAVEPLHPRIERQSERLLAALRERACVDPEAPLVATGSGARRVPGARVLDEVDCHAAGCFAWTRRPGALVVVGGHDTRAIRLAPDGAVARVTSNDHCAAGTGRFLEVILGRLQVPLHEAAQYVACADTAVALTARCTVFGEGEVVELVARGEPLEGIVWGIHLALAKRVAGIVGPLAPGEEVFFSGGVALNGAMVEALSGVLDRPVSVLPEPQLVGALGAALSARSS